MNLKLNTVDWSKIIETYQTSQLTQRTFCSKNNIKFTQFKYWHQQYKKHTEASLKKSGSQFVPIKLVSDSEKIDVEHSTITIHYKEIQLILPAHCSRESIQLFNQWLHQNLC